MTEHRDKTILLNNMQAGYAAFNELLASLSEGQMTEPGVNGAWSVKDNLAHLSACHELLVTMLQATKDGVDLPNPTPDMTEDQENEMFYQRNKGRSLADVQIEFRGSYQRVVDSVQSLTEEELNKPLSRLEGRNIWPYVVGNTDGHYEEHSHIIQDWLARG